MLIVVVLGVGAGVAYKIYQQRQFVKEAVPAAVDFAMVESQQTQSTVRTTSTALATSISTTTSTSTSNAPAELNLKMTFYSQAPFGDWSFPWQEACEEASALLVANTYFHHNWSRENFRDEILKLVEWETKTFGDYKDTNAAQIARFLKEYLGLDSKVYTDPSFEDVRTILERGHFILMPFDGKLIGNPNYKNGGPVYHVMVLKGFKVGASQKIITEDVGTRNGEDYVYPWSTLQNAMHEFAVPMSRGAKVMIEVLPPAPSA